jgi:molecular chaperone GrpE (heat shock protein)
MDRRLVLDEAKYKLFMLENSNWQKSIEEQEREIPGWEKRLLEAIALNAETASKRETIFFYSELSHQQKEMKRLESDIDTQQQRLAKDCEMTLDYDIDAFCTQDILRERIKAIERTYVELKCNFLNYIATIS